MTTKLIYEKEPRINICNIDDDIKRIIDAYSEDNRETLTDELLDIISKSDVVKILDENNESRSGTLRDVLRVCSTLGETDASLAWVVGVSNSAWSTRSNFRSLTSSVAAMKSNQLLAMVLGRPGLLTKDKLSGNYHLSGEWKYASGWQYSSYFFCLAVVDGDVYMVAVPSNQLHVTENWKAIGLRGTQSVTIRANDITIPASNIENYARILSGENRSAKEGHASYSGLFTGVLMNCLLGSILGATESGLKYVVSAVTKGPIAGSTYATMSDSGSIRSEIGRLRMNLDLYKRAAEYNADVIDNAARNSNVILTVQDRVDNRGRATHIMRGCVTIIEDLLWIYGSTGLNAGNPLERIWRDVNVGARHGGFSKFVPEEAVGLAFIGQDPRTITKMF